jgi:hypothetical protein
MLNTIYFDQQVGFGEVVVERKLKTRIRIDAVDETFLFDIVYFQFIEYILDISSHLGVAAFPMTEGATLAIEKFFEFFLETLSATFMPEKVKGLAIEVVGIDKAVLSIRHSPGQPPDLLDISGEMPPKLFALAFLAATLAVFDKFIDLYPIFMTAASFFLVVSQGHFTLLLS